MKLFLVLFLYCMIVFSYLQGVFPLALVAVAVFSYYASPLILIPTAVMIDGYFGNFYQVPWLSIGAVVWYIAVAYIRPKVFNVDA